MPSRNSRKLYISNTYYHVYNRGINKNNIFKDERDYKMFLLILKRHLSKKEFPDNRGRSYLSFYNDIDLLAFCLMPNHFHLLFFQKENENSLKEIMQKIGLEYTLYFNKRYKRVGPLFQGRYKASMIDNEAYLMHISRYIHLNPKDYMDWEWSSMQYYLKSMSAEWVKPDAILDLFKDISYKNFVKDYRDYRKSLTYILSEKADN